MLYAVGNPLRLCIVRVLSDGREHTCGSIMYGVPQPNLIHRYRVLRDAGIIWQRVSGSALTNPRTSPRNDWSGPVPRVNLIPAQVI